MKTLVNSELELAINCLICSNVMQESITVHCGHSFCRECTLKWCVQYKHFNCPVCRKKLDRHLPSVNVTLKLLIEHLTGKLDPKCGNLFALKRDIEAYNKINKACLATQSALDHEKLIKKVASELKPEKSDTMMMKMPRDSTLSRLNIVKLPFYFILTVYGFFFFFFLGLIKRLFK